MLIVDINFVARFQPPIAGLLGYFGASQLFQYRIDFSNIDGSIVSRAVGGLVKPKLLSKLFRTYTTPPTDGMQQHHQKQLLNKRGETSRNVGSRLIKQLQITAE